MATNCSPGRALNCGYLIFVRQGTLLAQRFDANRLWLTGDAFPVAENQK